MATDPAAPARSPLPLASLHQRLGARWLTLPEGIEVPGGYDAPAAEDAALRSGCGLVDRSWTDRLAVVGEDRQRFLNGMVTCDVKGLRPEEGVYGFFTEVKGHILADVVVWARANELWLELPPGRGEFIGRHLQKYLVADRVEIAPLADWLPLTLLGPASGELLAGLAPDLTLPAAAWGHGAGRLLGREVVVVAEGRRGVPAWTLWVRLQEAETLFEDLLGVAEEPSPRAVGFEALERLRVRTGVARFGPDFGPDNLPQETAIDNAVSYDKGCYLGQEVVARLHYRGQASRLLRGLLVEGERTPAAGGPVVHEGREVGRVTSAVAGAEEGRPRALAMLMRAAAEPGTRVEVEGAGIAEVVVLPFAEPG